MEFHVAAKLMLKACRPKSVDIYGTWSSCWVEEQRARDGWCSWRRWLTGCQGLIGECSDFELYSVVDRKPVEVTKLLTC